MDKQDDGDRKILHLLSKVGKQAHKLKPFRSVHDAEPKRPELREEDDMREGLWGLTAKETDLVMAFVVVVVLALTLAWFTWIVGGAF